MQAGDSIIDDLVVCETRVVAGIRKRINAFEKLSERPSRSRWYASSMMMRPGRGAPAGARRGAGAAAIRGADRCVLVRWWPWGQLGYARLGVHRGTPDTWVLHPHTGCTPGGVS